VSASPPTKVSARRYLAHLIDALVRIAAGVVPFVLLADRSTIDPTLADQYDRVDTFAVGADRAIRIDDRLFVLERKELVIIAAIALGVTLVFDILVQGRKGWTIGKLLTGLRTVNASGDRPGILRALVRTVLLVIDLIPSYLIPLVGGLFIFASDSNRRLGDLVAGTFVVDRDAWGEDPHGEDDVDTPAWESVEDHPGHVTRLAADEPLRVGEAAPAAAAAGGAAAAAPLTSRRQPEPDAEATDASATTDASEKPAYQPQWDPARKAYLQWDPRRKTWLQFDDESGEWQPIG
jgi:uncharacterized RDD family membrane protein YckC